MRYLGKIARVDGRVEDATFAGETTDNGTPIVASDWRTTDGEPAAVLANGDVFTYLWVLDCETGRLTFMSAETPFDPDLPGS